MGSVGLFEIEVLVIFGVDEVIDGQEALLVLVAILDVRDGWDLVDRFLEILMGLVLAHHIVVTDDVELFFVLFGWNDGVVVLSFAGASIVRAVQDVLHLLEMLVVVHAVCQYLERSGI